MSFLHPERSSRPVIGHFVVTISLVLLTFVLLGNVPVAIAYFLSENVTSDIIGTLKQSYGLTGAFVLIMSPLLCVCIVLYLCVKFIHKWTLKSIFTVRKNIDYKRIVMSFILWFLVLFITMIVGFNENILWKFNGEKFIVLLIVSLVVIPIQCVAEELLFRGYIYQWIGLSIKQPWIAIIITGSLFGFLHGGNPEVLELGMVALIYYVWSGFFLGMLVQVDQGLELSLGYHIANNLFATLIVTSNWQAFTTDALLIDTNPPSFTLEMMVLLLVGQIIFVLFFAKVLKWSKHQMMFWTKSEL